MTLRLFVLDHTCHHTCELFVLDHTCHPKTVFLPDQTCDPKTTCVFSRHITLGPNLELCQLVYGISPDDVYRSVQFSNTYYGSDQPKGSRIVFVNGETGFNDNTSSRFATVFLVSLLTYLCLIARWEHRPSTKERHRFLSVAIFSISLLVYPISFVSFSVSLCQVFRGLPLRLFPGGFHVMA